MRPTMRSLGSRFFDPRKLMLVAGLLAGMGLVVGYVEVHQQADRTLALRQGPPPTVRIQDFDAATHLGPADEVSLRAEMDFSQAVVLSLRGGRSEKHALVLPLFPVSDMGAVQIDAGARSARNALPKQLVRRIATGTDTPQAAGYLIHALPSRDAVPPEIASLAAEVFGQGAAGRVVTLNGVVEDPRAFTLVVDGAFAVLGVELAASYVAIAPFAEGREAALLGLTASSSHNILYVLALFLVLLAVGISMRDISDDSDLAPIDDLPDDGEEDRPASAHPMFAPIPSQQAIIERAQSRRSPARPSYGYRLARALWPFRSPR